MQAKWHVITRRRQLKICNCEKRIDDMLFRSYTSCHYYMSQFTFFFFVVIFLPYLSQGILARHGRQKYRMRYGQNQRSNLYQCRAPLIILPIECAIKYTYMFNNCIAFVSFIRCFYFFRIPSRIFVACFVVVF